ncbi:MAG: rhomboid family intramembrane serine protease [Planctomycetota bacterium]
MQQRPNVLRTTWQTGPIVSITIAINIVVFVLWHTADGPRGQAFMAENFLVSTLHLEHGRVWTLLTAAYSHLELWHIALNMFVLWSFGLVLEQLWRPRVFVGFYLIASVVGSACHCLATSYLLGDDAKAALGASGAVSGLLMAYALHFPRRKILLFGVVPVPALIGVVALVGIDVWGLIEQSRGGGVSIGHGAHLGGALSGALMWLFFLRTRFVPDEARATADAQIRNRA